ncbi:hypothetical protein ACFV10_35480 [Streptomyces cyaneofuscatus]|uniref:hypothetical protein n=1 Tax=Streptomyces cyaneofuscatus TaxID=66883 RepID=UPI0036757E63
MAQGKPVEAEVSARRAKLIRLRREGVRYDDPRILNLGYSDSGAARKDVIRALERNRADEAAEVGVYRQQENERLDSLLEAVWARATTPSPVFDREHEIVSHEIDLKAVDTVLKLMDRRAKLNGLDMPVKAELSGPDGGPMQLGPVSEAELELLMTIGRSAAQRQHGAEEEEAVGGDTDEG